MASIIRSQYLLARAASSSQILCAPSTSCVAHHVARHLTSGTSRPSYQRACSRSSGRQRRRDALLATALFSSTATTADSVYDFTVKDIDGKPLDLKKYKGKVILVVNVASACGFTPQYKELGELYNRYKDDGFVILGFPCNQFGGQEPGDNAAIKDFAKSRGAEFPMMSKVDVNGSKAEPFYSFLKSKQGGILTSDIKWNFTKILIDRVGNVVKRYGSVTTPLSIESDIKRYL